MKYFICFSFLIAVCSAQFFLPIPIGFPYPLGFPGRSEYAASLGGAKVGLFGRTLGLGPYGLGYPGYFGYPYGGSEVTGASLGGAPVGIYGKERQ